MGMKLVGRAGAGPMGGGVAVGHLQAGGFAERTGDISIGDILNAFVDDKKRTDVRKMNLDKVLQQSNCGRPHDRFVVPDLVTSRCKSLKLLRKSVERIWRGY